MTVESLTYAELAARLGVKPESARRLTQRRKWQRTIGNDGTARVLVPFDALPSPASSPMTSHPDNDAATQAVTRDSTGDVTPDNSATVAVLEAQIDGLKALIAAEAKRAEAAEARASAAEADRNAWKEQSDAWRSQAQRGLFSRLFG